MEKFFFVITDERDALAFELFLKSGPREQELANLEWTDLNLGDKPWVAYQCKEGFRTKNGKSRRVPLERGLADKLAAWRDKNPGTRYAFPTKSGSVEGHFLRTMHQYVRASGQNPDCFCAFTTCAVSSWESEELDERPHALFLTAARKSFGSC
jgi:integrase